MRKGVSRGETTKNSLQKRSRGYGSQMSVLRGYIPNAAETPRSRENHAHAPSAQLQMRILQPHNRAADQLSDSHKKLTQGNAGNRSQSGENGPHSRPGTAGIEGSPGTDTLPTARA